MSWNPNYSSALQNPTPLDVVNSGVFGPAVRRAFQNMGKVDVTYRAIPWSGVDLPTVTDLPLSPKDGAEVNYIADEANGVIWRFVFRQSTNHWHFVGGPPLYDEVTTNEQRNAATYADIATAGPSISLPLAGDYMVSTGFFGNNMTATTRGLMSYDIGGTAAVDADACAVYGDANASMEASVTRARRKTALSVVTLTAKYKASGGATSCFFGDRWISARPVRVA